MGAAPDERIRGGKPVHKAAADCLHVERGAAFQAELCLQQARGTGKYVIRGRRGDDDEIDRFCLGVGGLERLTRSFQGEIARRLRFVCDMALDDAGAAADPRVARLEARGEVVVGHHPRRQVAARADDARINHAAGTAIFCICPAIRCGTLFRTSSSALSSACAKARTSAEPWLLMTMPFNPTSVAPLYLAGSMRSRRALMTGVAISAASIFQGLRLNSSRRKPVIIFATPSDALRSELPTKPSQTTTSVVPL